MKHWGELEGQITDYIRSHSVGLFREVDALPPLDGAQLLSFLGAKSPGVYLELQELDPQQDQIELSGSLFVVIRHAGGQAQSRQAENALWALVEHLLSIMPIRTDAGDCFYAGKAVVNRDPELLRQSIASMSIAIKGRLAHPYPLSSRPESLADFLKFTAALDIEPFTPAHHEEWLQEPITEQPEPDCRINVDLPGAP